MKKPTEEELLGYIANEIMQAVLIKTGYTHFPFWKYVADDEKKKYLKLAKADLERWRQENK